MTTERKGNPVQPEKSVYGYGMTFSACLWLGVFPLLQGGTYSRITHDKWVIMLVLTCFTFLCFLFDLIIQKKPLRNILPDKTPEDLSSLPSTWSGIFTDVSLSEVPGE